jgi:hypothetical protein
MLEPLHKQIHSFVKAFHKTVHIVRVQASPSQHISTNNFLWKIDMGELKQPNCNKKSVLYMSYRWDVANSLSFILEIGECFSQQICFNVVLTESVNKSCLASDNGWGIQHMEIAIDKQWLHTHAPWHGGVP